jgi:acetyl-CoA carboxylase biotin carboxylase subunit
LEDRLHKILIANRGEIALRIIRAAKELGIETVAVFSDGDRDSLAVRLADEAYCIGEDKLTESYLNIEKIISTAKKANCTAIHPGYGFLSENAEFAKKVIENGIIFIGPNHKTIIELGDKIKARETAEKCGVPVIPGYNGEIKSGKQAKEIAKKIGYPLILKAAHGGGGRGMRIVTEPNNLVESVKQAISESLLAFGSKKVFIEKFVETAKHIEVQILADNYGNVIHLFERDCSIQRKHQKMVEEAPCSILNKSLRKKLFEYAKKIIKFVEYSGAATVEFLFDGKKNFYFLEVNPRIQVEHPISEMITGIDIVKEQIKISLGEKLSFEQSDIKILGHSIETRILAERNDENGLFHPSFGKIDRFVSPCGMGIRMETACYSGMEISPKFDSMIGKLISFGKTRGEAIRKMQIALSEIIIDGIESNILFLRKIMKDSEFESGFYFTNFIPEMFLRTIIEKNDEILESAAIISALLRFREEKKKLPVSDKIKKVVNRWNLAGRTEGFRSRRSL